MQFLANLSKTFCIDIDKFIWNVYRRAKETRINNSEKEEWSEKIGLPNFKTYYIAIEISGIAEG